MFIYRIKNKPGFWKMIEKISTEMCTMQKTDSKEVCVCKEKDLIVFTETKEAIGMPKGICQECKTECLGQILRDSQKRKCDKCGGNLAVLLPGYHYEDDEMRGIA
ncbi:MAG: hypothetical protein ABIJ28_01175 [Patescibacteria group bacterium]